MIPVFLVSKMIMMHGVCVLYGRLGKTAVNSCDDFCAKLLDEL